MSQHFTDEQRHLIVYLYQKGISERKIGMELSPTKIWVNVPIKQSKETEKFSERAGRGRKRKSTKRQDRSLVRLSLATCRLTSPELCREWHQSPGIKIAPSTI